MFDYLTAHGTDILGIVLGVIGVASLIANLTGDSDNKIIATISKFVDLLAANWVKK